MHRLTPKNNSAAYILTPSPEQGPPIVNDLVDISSQPSISSIYERSTGQSYLFLRLFKTRHLIFSKATVTSPQPRAQQHSNAEDEERERGVSTTFGNTGKTFQVGGSLGEHRICLSVPKQGIRWGGASTVRPADIVHHSLAFDPSTSRQHYQLWLSPLLSPPLAAERAHYLPIDASLLS